MIQIKKLTTGYSRDKPLLKDFSFDFKDNRIYGILGESGCGKTTLLKTMAGLIYPLSAAIKADERAEIISDIERSKKLIAAYSTAKADAIEVHKACEANLKKLRRDSKEVVENMRVKEQLNDVYDSMDDLKNTTATDKLLASIKEKNEDLDASVAGARVVHENKTSTKVQRVNEKAKKIENDEYLESLKKKYNRK